MYKNKKGNNSYSKSLEEFHKSKNMALNMFQQETKRKITIHILSNNTKDGNNLVEFLTNQKNWKIRIIREKYQ